MKRMILLCIFVILASSTSYAQNTEVEAMIYLKNAEPYVLAEQSAEEAQLSSSDKNLEVVKRQGYIDRLKQYAKTEQAHLISILFQGKSEGFVSHYQSYYIINAVYVKGERSWIQNLYQVPGIISIEFQVNNNQNTVKPNPALSLLTSEVAQGREHGWEMQATRVIDVWNNYGLNGEGVVIGFIDSGVDGSHPAVQLNYRGYGLGEMALEANPNWLDLIGVTNEPTDTVEHGTSVVASTLGLDPSSQYRTGVATGAKWIAVRAFDQQVSTNQKIIEAGQWMLAPGGDPANAPDIINNSWGSLELDTPIFNAMVDAWKAADILPIFAAGNDVRGAVDGSIENPANQPGTLAVGAVDKNLKIAWFSKRGPNSGNVKPEIVAPGMNMTTAVFEGYGSYVRGTSIAAGHVSGIAALVMEANPSLNQKQVQSILIDSARPLTDNAYPESPNNAYGYGLIDANKAVEMAIEFNLKRIYGESRVETSLEVAKQFFENGADTVYFVSAQSNSSVDAFLASSLMKLSQGPILLANEVNTKIKDYLNHISPTRIVLVGGPNAISEAFAQEIYNTTGVIPERMAGEDRYETAAKIAEQGRNDTAFLVSGQNLADAVSIASVSAKKGSPILLTNGKDLSPDTLTFLNNSDIKEVIVIGGSASVPDSILDYIHPTVTRISGSDRYETNSLVVNGYYQNTENAIIANGETLVDAFCAAPISNLLNSPIILTQKDIFPESALNYVLKNNQKNIIVIGGVNSVAPKALLNLSRH